MARLFTIACIFAVSVAVVSSTYACDPKTDPSCDDVYDPEVPGVAALEPLADPISTPGAQPTARVLCDPKQGPGCDGREKETCHLFTPPKKTAFSRITAEGLFLSCEKVNFVEN